MRGLSQATNFLAFLFLVNISRDISREGMGSASIGKVKIKICLPVIAYANETTSTCVVIAVKRFLSKFRLRPDMTRRHEGQHNQTGVIKKIHLSTPLTTMKSALKFVNKTCSGATAIIDWT